LCLFPKNYYRVRSVALAGLFNRSYGCSPTPVVGKIHFPCRKSQTLEDQFHCHQYTRRSFLGVTSAGGPIFSSRRSRTFPRRFFLLNLSFVGGTLPFCFPPSFGHAKRSLSFLIIVQIGFVRGSVGQTCPTHKLFSSRLRSGLSEIVKTTPPEDPICRQMKHSNSEPFVSNFHTALQSLFVPSPLCRSPALRSFSGPKRNRAAFQPSTLIGSTEDSTPLLPIFPGPYGPPA